MTFLENQAFSWRYWSCTVTVIVRKIVHATKSLITNWRTGKRLVGNTANTSFPSRRDLTGTSCSGFNLSTSDDHEISYRGLYSRRSLPSSSPPLFFPKFSSSSPLLPLYTQAKRDGHCCPCKSASTLNNQAKWKLWTHDDRRRLMPLQAPFIWVKVIVVQKKTLFHNDKRKRLLPLLDNLNHQQDY